jgi:PKD repeat protein
VGPDAVGDSARGPRGYDEINFADAPGNYGWPYCIGFNAPYDDFDFETDTVGPLYSCEGRVPALVAYDYVTVSYLALGNALDPEGNPGIPGLPVTGRTSIAGVFYRRPVGAAPFALPPLYQGTLLMTDWTRDVIASVEVSESGELTALRRLLPWESFRRPIDIETGPDGALYVLEYGTSFFGDNTDAQLSRIEYSASGRLTPVAVAAASVTAGQPPLEVTFTAAGSRAPGDRIASYEWDFDGDGEVDASGAEVTHTFGQGGSFPVALVVVGASGRRSFPAVVDIIVANTPPVVEILQPADGIAVPAGTTVTLIGQATDAEDGPAACLGLVWDIRLGHNSHSHPINTLSGCEVTFRALPSGHPPGTRLFYAVELTYTDKGGPNGEPALTGRDSILINVQ